MACITSTITLPGSPVYHTVETILNTATATAINVITVQMTKGFPMEPIVSAGATSAIPMTTASRLTFSTEKAVAINPVLTAPAAISLPISLYVLPSGAGVLLPDGKVLAAGSITIVSGVQISLPTGTVTNVVVNGQLIPITALGSQVREFVEIGTVSTSYSALDSYISPKDRVLVLPDGQILTPGSSVIFQGHKIEFLAGVNGIRVDGLFIETLAPLIRDGTMIGGLIRFPDGKYMSVMSMTSYNQDKELWSSMLAMLATMPALSSNMSGALVMSGTKTASELLELTLLGLGSGSAISGLSPGMTGAVTGSANMVEIRFLGWILFLMASMMVTESLTY